MRRMRHNLSMLTMLLLYLPQTTCGTLSANYWSGLGGARKSTFPFGRWNSILLFSNPPNPQRFRVVIHLPRSHFLSGNFYFNICEWHIRPARAWTPALMLHLTNPCTKQKVLILTKPKSKIYKTRCLRNYITHRIMAKIRAYAGMRCKQPKPHTMSGPCLTIEILVINIRLH